MKRREFLQGIGWVLAALGMEEAVLARWGDRYRKVLAQPTARKLALLVGVNQYRDRGSPVTPLLGCVTDVELQRELLIHRFGFHPDDILTLTDARATRQSIEEAFLHHLIQQAKPEDVVVFHFSGYGRVLADTQGNGSGDPLIRNTLMPVDGLMPSEGGEQNDLLQETLWLLLRSLPTQQAIAVLDTSYTYPGTNLQGLLRIRTLPDASGKPSTEGLAFQQRLLTEFGSENSGFQLGRSPESLNLPGLVLRAASAMKLASETQWAGFSAGLFTYALTQQLWWATVPLSSNVMVQRTTSTIAQMGSLPPSAIAAPALPAESESALASLLETASASANGVVTGVDDGAQSGQVWLAGIPAPVLGSYQPESTLLLLPDGANGNGIPLIAQVRSLNGLTAKVQLTRQNGEAENGGGLQLGQLVSEAIRVLPRDLNLVVALDNGLERIERIDATSAFSSVPYVSAVSAGDRPADCLFGSARLARKLASSDAEFTVPQSSYGLFLPSQEFIPETAGDSTEAVKTAVQRLGGSLHSLLATKLLRFVGNEGSSRLGVQATLNAVDREPQVLWQQETLTAPFATQAIGESIASPLVSIPAGGGCELNIHNQSDRPLYFLLFDIRNNGLAIATYALQWQGQEQPSQGVKEYQGYTDPNATVLFPLSSSSAEWKLSPTSGWAELTLVCSSAPFTETLRALEAEMWEPRFAKSLRSPLKVMQAMLLDLNAASATAVGNLGISSNTVANFLVLDTSAWASLSFAYRTS
ncbi:MAG: caspase family protein [Coleofasciculaceae cyanobacterium SM2_3_26]|nr:caspase family protein [Coleofasciculaceae cyanobacterium SM2_3_26]